MKIHDKYLEKLPPLYATEDIEDPVAHIKIFNFINQWVWYATEYDNEKELFFGLVLGFEKEHGYFTKAELEDAPGMILIEDFVPKPLSKALEEMESQDV